MSLTRTLAAIERRLLHIKTCKTLTQSTRYFPSYSVPIETPKTVKGRCELRRALLEEYDVVDVSIQRGEVVFYVED